MSFSPSSRARRVVAWLALVVMAAAGAAWWWNAGRPVPLPDAPSARIACVSYAPFRKPGETPLDPHAFVSPGRIDADLRALSARFDCVRTYSQGQGLSVVPEIAARYHMRVLMGIWLGSDRKANARQIALGIATARKYPQVLRGVVVGNEVLLRGDLSERELAGYLREVRAALPAAIPVTYADVWEFWLAHPALAGGVDFVTVHILPYWEDQPVPPEAAVQHVADVYARVEHAFPGKAVMIGETGWPSEGRPRRGAAASRVNEARYLREFLDYAASVHMPYNVIEAFDQPWKRAQEGTVGGYWGIFDAHAQPKFPMQGPVVEIPRWWLGWLAGALGAALFMLLGARQRRARGWRHALALALAGAAGGMALGWQVRQMLFACHDAWEWSVSGVAWLVALFTGVRLARWLAGRLAGAPYRRAPAGRWRSIWLFALALYGLLLVFDGRYRDFPLGLFALPCAGYALTAWLDARVRAPSRETLFLAGCLPLLGGASVALELGLDPATWWWLALNLALALPVVVAWAHSRSGLVTARTMLGVSS
ncbi:MAG: glycoside hydrolase family 17 [Rhodanobacter sp.]|nr:MAG: glycoside hydrolase family 17 [Rhodanobacter sp.]TAM08466.1 MAG: glycoside hydrolase family 17 [Rhodanobacter sp.]TAM36594.1 MAG: glycoside hydrolase family 17 [Rhodanobacter sp.]